jgi:hypothetical protein
VPPETVLPWVEEFMWQSGEQEFWKTRTKAQFVLRLRDAIAEAGRQLPDFSGAIKWSLATVTPQQ